MAAKIVNGAIPCCMKEQNAETSGEHLRFVTFSDDVL
jgi:hypothetical protein